jgi:ER protein Pkr1
MATFFENLWGSVFTPGTTPTLLLATNATFAALQFVLGALLIGTRSVHFAVLSTLCAGLWWAINWFADELRKAEKAEEEAGRLRKRRSGLTEEQKEPDTEDYGDDETETETELDSQQRSFGSDSATLSTGREEGGPTVRIRGGPQKILGVMQSAKGYAEPEVLIKGGPSKFQALLGDEALGGAAGGATSSQGSRKSLGEETGSVSTDSEWEKVSDR